MTLLSVEDLTVEIQTRHGTVHALERVSLDVGAGEIVGIIGESGSGKSVCAYTIMGVLDRAARIKSGRVRFQGQDLLTMSPTERERWRGSEASMIFQNARSALNPSRRIGDQLCDVIARHHPASASAIRERALQALSNVRLTDPERQMEAYPHKLSVGQCQRVGIAAALACGARLLIADEPTSALDVTTQAEIMGLIRDLSREKGMAVLLITHDLALAASYCDRLTVMHAGHVVETGPTEQLIAAPRHPYTAALLKSAPAVAESLADLKPIGGSLPDLRRTDLPPCRFAERCERRLPCCEAALPLRLVGVGHSVACHNPL